MIFFSLVFTLSYVAYFYLGDESRAFGFVLVALGQSVAWLLLYARRQRLPLWWLAACVVTTFVIVRLAGPPQFEDDYFRFFWDGLHLWQNLNPYDYSPAESPLVGFDTLRNQVGYGELPTLYPPVAQLLFSAFAGFSLFSLPAFLWLFSAGGAIAVALGLRALRVGWSEVLVLLLNPLLTREWFYACHYDSWMAAFVLLALQKHGAVWVSLATNTKFIGGVALLFTQKSGRGWWWHWAIALVLPWLVFASAWNRIGVSLKVFAMQWEMNSGAYRALRAVVWLVVGHAGPARFLTVALWALLLIWLSRLRLRSEEKTFWALFLLPLVSPTANPWYFTWSLPLVVFLPESRRGAALAAFTPLPLAYAFYAPELNYLLLWNLEHALIWAAIAFVIVREKQMAQGKWPVSLPPAAK